MWHRHLYKNLSVAAVFFCLAGEAWAGSAPLAWTEPPLNEDGTSYTDPSHYTIQAGCTQSGQYEEQTIDNIPHTVTSLTVNALPAGTCYFVITATNLQGETSRYSAETTKFIGELSGPIENLQVTWQESHIVAFTDDFNRADEDLDASANWSTPDTAGDAAVVSNQVDGIGGDSAFLCPDQGSADHFSQAALLGTLSYAGFISVRTTDANNFIGIRFTGGAIQLFKRDTGSFTLLDSFTISLVDGDVYKLEVSGNDFVGSINGTPRVSATDAFNNTETRQGIIARGSNSAWLDDFEADVVAAAGAAPSFLPILGVG